MLGNAIGDASDQVDAAVRQHAKGHIAHFDPVDLCEFVDHHEAKRVLLDHGGLHDLVRVDVGEAEAFFFDHSLEVWVLLAHVVVDEGHRRACAESLDRDSVDLAFASQVLDVFRFFNELEGVLKKLVVFLIPD